MLTQDQINKLLRLKIRDLDPSTITVLAVRGNEGENRIGVFDDRAYVVYDWTLKGTWRMNTDPSSDAVGRAHLISGVYDYRAGKHHINSPAPKGRAAFVQAGRVRIYRTGHGFESGWFGINLHDARGGSTSSLACQTWNQGSDFYNDDGTGFRDVLYRLLGVTPEQVMANPSGVGRKFKYVLVTSAEVTKMLRLAQLGSL
jgi:hypothetical protein